MAKYLLEIGTEELPYKFIPSALEQLKELFSAYLKDKRVKFERILTYGTPRRLSIIIEGLSERQPDVVREIKGPPAKIAYDTDGNLTNAGLGFAKKQNLDPSILEKKVIDGTEYLWASVKEAGLHVQDVLKEAVPALVLNLQGARFMRWGDLDIRFSRPIRWIVSLLDEQEVKINIANVESSRESWGHRFANPMKIAIQSPDTYLDDLLKVKVIADNDKRREEIVKQIHAAAESKGGVPKINPELLKEVTNLVEYPYPVIGSFDSKYLEVTQDVIVSVLAYHQKYFPVYDKQGKLLNYFITLANHDSQCVDNIRRGNERVVKARLDDAIFFYREDTKKQLKDRVEELKGVTFQKGLGSVYDKMLRIKEISAFLAEKTGLSDDMKKKIERTAYLCKADLVTNLVREFTELQGIIGADYARLNGEDELVSTGIKEHYMPVSADGELAQTTTGQVVGIADKIDTICGVFALDKAPTGSADPMGLRRAALGIIKTVIDSSLSVNVTQLIEKAVAAQPIKPENAEKLIAEIKEFVVQRLRILLNEKYRYDVVDAVLGAKDPLADIKDVIARLGLINELVNKDSYKAFHESANRIQRIIKDQKSTNTVNNSLLKEEQESALWVKASSISETCGYPELIKELEALIPYIERFFDKVLVMDKDADVKQNRINLLSGINSKFMAIADFSKIVF